MPKLDGTGPTGAGPMTGRGLGHCGGGMRLGWCGQGFGLGLGRSFRSPKNQLQILEQEKQVLIDELEAINSEIESLKNQK
jgi:hypothetical protein